MKRHWYLVGHRAGARIFEQQGRTAELKLIEEIDNPEGHLRNQELKSDKAGRADSNAAPGGTPFFGTHSPRHQVLVGFAKQLSASLEERSSAFDSLVLVAEPQLLGELKKLLGMHASKKLRETVGKDLVHVSSHEMTDHLREVLFDHEEVRA